MRVLAVPALFAIFALAGCAGEQGARAPTFDAPIPPSEARASLQIMLDLEPVSDCDERFDLALYEDRGVELVTWDDAPRGGCTGRRATVRYVPKRTARDALLKEIQKISRKVQVTQG